jgi:hypothetical protein
MNKALVLVFAGCLLSAPVIAQDRKPASPAPAEKSTGTPPSTQKSMEQSKANETVLGTQTKGGGPVPDDAKAQARRIEDDYKAARKDCDRLKGAEERACNKQARDARSKARAELRANQKQARASTTAKARTDKADRARADAKANAKQ